MKRNKSISWFTPTPEAYADRIAPLLVSPDLEAHSGAMFNQKGQPILPSPQLEDSTHVGKFLGESETLAGRVLAQRDRFAV